MLFSLVKRQSLLLGVHPSSSQAYLTVAFLSTGPAEGGRSCACARRARDNGDVLFDETWITLTTLHLEKGTDLLGQRSGGLHQRHQLVRLRIAICQSYRLALTCRDVVGRLAGRIVEVDDATPATVATVRIAIWRRLWLRYRVSMFDPLCMT